MPSAATPLLTRPATELAELVRSGQLRSRELVEAALERIAEMHALNAFTLVDAEGALAAADAIMPGDPRPFAGIPMAIKELNAVAGQPLTMGSDLYGDYRPDMDAYVVRRLKDAGFVLDWPHRRARIRHPPRHRVAPLWPDTQSLESRPHPRRIIGRRGRSRGGGHSAGGSRLGWRRIDSCASGMLWVGGPEGEPGAYLSRTGPRR